MDFGDRSVIDIDDPTALNKLAIMYDTVVLDLERPHDRLFVVVAEQTVYRYAEPRNDPHQRRDPHTSPRWTGLEHKLTARRTDNET